MAVTKLVPCSVWFRRSQSAVVVYNTLVAAELHDFDFHSRRIPVSTFHDSGDAELFRRIVPSTTRWRTRALSLVPVHAVHGRVRLRFRQGCPPPPASPGKELAIAFFTRRRTSGGVLQMPSAVAGTRQLVFVEPQLETRRLQKRIRDARMMKSGQGLRGGGDAQTTVLTYVSKCMRHRSGPRGLVLFPGVH